MLEKKPTLCKRFKAQNPNIARGLKVSTAALKGGIKRVVLATTGFTVVGSIVAACAAAGVSDISCSDSNCNSSRSLTIGSVGSVVAGIPIGIGFFAAGPASLAITIPFAISIGTVSITAACVVESIKHSKQAAKKFDEKQARQKKKDLTIKQ